MSQQQMPQFSIESEPIKYGDVFDVSGELASQPVVARDAAAMQAAENALFGQTQRGGPAAVMESAAAVNERFGLLGRRDAGAQGVTVTERIDEGNRVITEAVGGQVVGQYVEAPETTEEGEVLDPDAITIGEALEATALSVPEKPIDQSDAAAIQAAEMRATGITTTLPGGIGSMAQAAATRNTRTVRDEDKTTVFDVIGDATEKLPSDKAVTREDAQGVIGAEIRNKADMTTTPGGVAASMAAAARLNQSK